MSWLVNLLRRNRKGERDIEGAHAARRVERDVEQEELREHERFAELIEREERDIELARRRLDFILERSHHHDIRHR